MSIRSFTVDAVPIGQPRHRITTRGKFARMYLPVGHPIHEFKCRVRQAFGRKNPAAGPIAIMIQAFMPRPQSKTWKRREMLRYAHTGKPDMDNIAKAVIDALNGVAWRDDGQIFSLIASKWVCGGDESPRVQVSITETNTTGC